MDPCTIDSVILTHAHLDHCGRLPMLMNREFSEHKCSYGGEIWSTKPTVELTSLVLEDAARLQEGGVKRGGFAPLYDEMEVVKVMGRFKPTDYERVEQATSDVSFKYLDAGHILGSASVVAEIKASNGGKKTIVFSGDLGNEPSPIVGLIDEPRFADVVVMESTYGDRLHEPRGKEMEMIGKYCREIERTKGTLLIPAFSLERTQELLQIFDTLKKTGGASNELRVYLDTPMGMRATAIYEKYPEYFNEKTRALYRLDDPFDFPGLTLVEYKDQSQRINNELGAKVIIAGSGMMTGGRIVFHAARWLGDAKSILLFTGYQAKGTRGRHIQDGDRRIVIEGKLVEINARIEQVNSMSGHADQNQLMDWLKQIQGVKKVILTHGEEGPRMALEELIKKEFSYEVVRPLLNDVVEI